MTNVLSKYYRRWQESRRKRDQARADARVSLNDEPIRKSDYYDPTGSKISSHSKKYYGEK